MMEWKVGATRLNGYFLKAICVEDADHFEIEF